MSISKTIEIISSINECVTLFQWVTSAVSSLRSQCTRTRVQNLEENDVLQLQSDSEEQNLQEDEALQLRGGSEEQKLQEDEVLQLQRDLTGLRDSLPVAYNLIDLAEWRSHENCVAELLPKLKDAVYEAEDLLEEFRWYEQKMKVEGNATEVSPIIDFFCSVIKGTFNKVTNIHERIKDLSSMLQNMGFHQATPRFDKAIRPETTSFPTEPKIFGRDEELKQLIRLLGVPATSIGDPSSRKRTRSGVEATITSLPVLPIVGIGGVGKTTLSQNICSHPQVDSHFKKIIWICVSDEFDVQRLTKEAIQFFGEEAKTDNLDFLQRALANYVKQERFLIVLDDMWDDALNGDCWKKFCAPFKNVRQGSMMLVTTRFPKVAELVCTMDPFPLGGLKDDVFWDFFKQCVLRFDSSDIGPELELIGKEILPKLKGSPLAAKTLGRLLGMNRHTTHWNNILKSKLWELKQEETDIWPALRLSYIYLPPHLKRCFSFCAVYPKDYELKKDCLAQMWVAEGFVEPQGSIPLQDIGCQYFEDLVDRSFIQNQIQNVRSKYVMHDLIHDMAQLVSKGECFTIKYRSDFKNVPENVRHLLIQPNNDVKRSDLSSLAKHKKLRTLLCYKSLRNMTSVLEHWCTELRCMRVIFFDSIRELPKSIGNMKHLRYLKISKNCDCSSLLTEICCLYNLQRLYAKNCESDNSPGVSDKLINLQTNELLVRGYPGESLPTWFHPKHLPNLTSLSLYNCNGLTSIPVAGNSQRINLNAPAVLVDNMVADDSIGSSFSSRNDVAIEKCKNLSSLEQFLQPAYIPAIKKLVISNCGNVESVPTERFEDLPSLEELTVCDCPKINSQHLLAPSLKKLKLENSGNLGENIECRSLTILVLSHQQLASIELQKWILPKLQELEIRNCHPLTFIRESEPIPADVSHGSDRSSTGKFPLLTHLTITSCEKLQTLDDQLLYLPAIESISIRGCDMLSLPTGRFGSFRFLKDLDLLNCRGLNWESGTVLPSSLRKLSLWGCGDFSVCFPSCLENLTSLESLQIGRCERIMSIPDHLWTRNLASLQELRIQYCENLESIGGQKAIANIKKVLIEDCEKLKSLKRGRW